jgi:hypothetical protein
MLIRSLYSLLLFAILASGTANAGSRSALVIGNAQYSFGPLANPANDAADVAAALKTAGFDVTLKTDVTRAEMREAIRTFGQALKAGNGVGLFYFAGHGVQISGENFLLPVGEAFASEIDIKARTVNASEVVDVMAAARSYLNIVVLDACRDNALGNTSTRGLSRIDTNARLFISFSTSPGSVALDGSSRNSPFTKHLVQAIGNSDLSIEETFKRTLKGVYQETRGKQTPWISSSFFGDFIFRSTKTQAVALAAPEGRAKTGVSELRGQRQNAVLAPMPALPPAPPVLTGIYRVEGTNPNGSRYRGMVAIVRNGDRFTFRWWIGKQIFDGSGELAGRMLVVHWGDKTPVVYSFGPLGVLDGEWADGTAAERLTPFGQGVADGAAVKEGRYNVLGRNSNGGTYTGFVTIKRQHTFYSVDWNVGGSSYHGTGTLDGSLLSVSWGSSTPVVYAVSADGSLKGLWDAGAGEETLQPEQ